MSSLLRLAVLVASATAAVGQVLDDDPPPPPPTVIPGCTTSSFAIPSWFVSNFTYQKADDVAEFNLLNRATNTAADLACANSTTRSPDNNLWSRCFVTNNDGNKTDEEALLVLVQVAANSSAANLLISQGWTCSDRNLSHPIKFAATGSTSLAMRCTDSACAQANDAQDTADTKNAAVLIKGSLQNPVALTPAYAKGPIGHSQASCARGAAQPPQWSLQSVYYLNQTGDDGKTSIASQTLMLQVINHDIGYQAGCVGFLPDDLSTRPTAFNCSGQGYDFVGKDRYRIQTQALFEPATFRLTVNQTWYCDEDPASPVSISASGSMVLPLNCTSVPINATDGGAPGNKTTCVSDGDIVIKGEQPGQASKLPPYSIEDPLPTPDGCTVSSVVSPAWTFSGFEVDGPAANATSSSNTSASASSSSSSSSSVGFNVKLTTATNEFPYPTSIYQGAAVAGRPHWYTCTFGPGEVPMAPYNCSFTYDAATKEITLAADWICSDLDAKHPILFSGVAKTTVTQPLACSTTPSGQSQCFTDEDTTWTAPISNVTWGPADNTILAAS